MGKQWVRREIKKNEIADTMGLALAWVRSNRQKTLGVGGAALAVLGLASLFAYRTSLARNTAWERLALAQSFAFQGQYAAAAEQLKTIEERFSNTPGSGFGLLFAGDLLYRQGRYEEAAGAYQRLLDRRPDKALLPIAMSDLGLALEAAGNCQGSVEAGERFLGGHQDHFLAPQVQASLARCLDRLGRKEKAGDAYKRITLLHPDSYWAQWAQSRL